MAVADLGEIYNGDTSTLHL